MFKKNFKFFLILITILFFIIVAYKIFYKTTKNESLNKIEEKESYNLNIIKNVKYNTKDKDGNEYIIHAKEGEIDFSKPNILFLTNVDALIKLKNSNQISIISDYGKYNSQNLDTIFSKNVIIKYLNNKITSDYLDFSLQNNLMVISKNVYFDNSVNIMKADVVEMNIDTKDSKIFMYEKQKMVNIKSKN